MTFQPARVFDFHVHCYPDAVAARAVENVTRSGLMTAHLDGTVQGLLAGMRRDGFTGALNLPLALSPQTERGVNRWAAELHNSEHPIYSLGSVHPDTPDPETMLTWIKSLGLPGIKIHSEFQEVTADDPRMEKIYEVCEKLDLFILFHTGVDLIFERERPTAGLSDFMGVATRFPQLRFILAHMGGIETLDIERTSYKGLNVWFDLAYVPSCTNPDTLARVIREVGVERVLYGTDSPWYDQGAHLREFLQTPLNPDEFDTILWRNATTLIPQLQA